MEDWTNDGRQFGKATALSDDDNEAAGLVEMDSLARRDKDDEEDPLNSDPVVVGELARLKTKNRKMKRSLHMLLIFSCTMVLIVLFFSYRAYRIYYPPTNVTDDGNSTNATTTTAAEGRYAAFAATALGDMDTSAEPCHDFYRYACGGWLDRTTLEADESRESRSFSSIAEQNGEILLGLLQNQSLPYLSGLYSTCADTALADDASGQHELLNLLGSSTDLRSLYAVSAQLRLQHGIDIGLFFSLSVSIDDRDPTRYVPVLWQASPLLPDASYYEDAALLARYRSWMAEAFLAAGVRAPSNATLQRYVELEQALLGISNSPAENRDPESTYNLLPADQLPALLQDAAVYVDAVLPNATAVNVAQFQYFLQLYSTLDGFSFTELQYYAMLRLIAGTLTMFGAEQRAAALSRKTLIYGVSAAPSRDEFCVGVAQSLAGMRLAYFYVQSQFDERSRNIAGDMIGRIERSYVDTVGELAWMDSATQAAAIGKLNAIANMVGHPDVWPEWHEPTAGATLFEYYTNASRQADAAMLRSLSQPVDTTEWEMLPSEVNAYYEPSLNTIVFPAGILQPPFFDSAQPVAMNYGAIGSVIGHELGHSLDDQGSQYTADGTLSDWWSAASRAAFEAAAQCVSDLYSSFEVIPDVFVNGELVLGESLADMGGLRQSYRALLAWRRDYAALAEIEERDVQEAFGMSSEQLYFLSYAQNWCQKSTRGYEIMLTASNPHPLSRFRVQGPLSQSSEFAEAFSCPAGSSYNPAEKCQVW
jgi:predicted metalloendopeptidase